MAFLTPPVFTQITDSIVEITGLSVAKGATGTIGLYGVAADANLPATFKPDVYPYASALLTPADVIDVSIQPVATHVGTNLPYITKSVGGTWATPFLISFINANVADSPVLSVWVRFHK